MAIRVPDPFRVFSFALHWGSTFVDKKERECGVGRRSRFFEVYDEKAA